MATGLTTSTTHGASQSTCASPEYHVLLFGDLSSTGFEDGLRRLSHVKNNPLLSSFLDQVGLRLRELVGGLPSQHQDFFPRFTTLIDLVARIGETSGTPVLRFFALSVYEIAQFVV